MNSQREHHKLKIQVHLRFGGFSVELHGYGDIEAVAIEYGEEKCDVWM